MCWLT
jgi:acyl carrier protein